MLCVFRKMLSLSDPGTQTINEFNKNINRCFATNTTPTGCLRVSFGNTLQMQRK